MKSLSGDIKLQYQVFRRILTYIRPYKGRMIAGITCSALAGVFGFSPVVLLQQLFDRFIELKDRIPLKYMYAFCSVIIVLYILKGVITYAQQYLLSWVGQRVIMDLRVITFTHLTHLPLRFFKEKNSGELISRLLNDIGLIESAVTRVLGRMILSIFSFVPPFFAVFYISWRMAIVSLFILPLTLYPILKFAQKLKKVSSTGQEQMASLTGTMHEAFYGIQIIKAFTMEQFKIKKFARFNREYYNASMRAARVSALSPALMEMIGAVATAVIFGMGLSQIIAGTLTTGYLFAFLTSLFLMYDPIKKMSRLNYDIQRAIAGAERTFEVLDALSTIIERDDALELKDVKGEVTFDHVSFAYEPGEMVLNDISATIRSGENVAIVGPSGVGKSTMASLIPRFYDPVDGRILIDGIDIRDLTLRSLREQIGIVTQETILFNDSIANNLTYGRNDITEEAMIAAAKAAFAHEFIEALPNGYRTVIGERGVTLSGGQKQRLTIARALLKNPPILILDEATSSLDSQSESLIQQALDRLIENRTTIIIAHRLSTIRKADRILAMENGRIVEMGTHDELLRKKSAYSRLYEIQFSDASSGSSGSSRVDVSDAEAH
ncbi:ABC transporter ATP-binding protein [bacterium]|nr:ABC transporter ATP-binding protein [candidate division CSSED10-310 bacterium]